MQIRKCLLLAVILFKISFCFGQKELDTLQHKSLQELFDLYEESNSKSEKIKFIKAFVTLAKKKRLTKKITSGYFMLSGLYEDEKALYYCDSIIDLTKNNPTKNYPALGYISKATFYNLKGDLEKAIDNYLIANKLLEEQGNFKLLMVTNYSIGTIKRNMGEYDAALNIYKKNISYNKKDNRFFTSNYYLTNLMAISNVYYEKKNIDSASYYNNIGVLESLKHDDIDKFNHFSANQGIVNFFKGDYNVALDSLRSSYSYFKKKNNPVDYSYVSFYLGKIYEAKGENIKTVKFYKKIDSIFQLRKDLSPKMRHAYEYLIKFYKKNKDIKQQLFFINRLISFDSIFRKKENYINKKIFKEYDIPKLKAEKEFILKTKRKDKIIFQNIILSIITILIITIFFLVYQYKKKKLYKKRVQEILNKSSNSSIKKEIKVPKSIIDSVLKELTLFETNLDFLSKNITLVSLADSIGTNTNYLSKVINFYKKTTFSNYLNSLRIEYVIELLKKDKTIRKFTIKAIAEEVGFNNAESFSKAFFKLKGIKPSYFLKELIKVTEKQQ